MSQETSGSPEPVLEATDLSRVYGDGNGVFSLDLSLFPGEIFGLLGPNGAGKSTSMYLLLGLIHPDEGTVFINGADVRKRPEQSREGVGVLLEKPTFYPTLTGPENIQVMNVHNEEVDATEAKEMMEEVGLERTSDKYVRHYSSGMKQRLAIASALAGSPNLVFLDEPTSNLDPDGRDRMLSLFERRNKQHNTTFFYSTHRIEEAERLCNRVGILKNGELKTTVDPTGDRDAEVTRIAVAVNQVEEAISFLGSFAEQVQREASDDGVCTLTNPRIPAWKINKKLVEEGFQVRRFEIRQDQLLSIYRNA